MSISAPRDANRIPTLITESSTDQTPVVPYTDPTTHRLLVDTGGVSTTSPALSGLVVNVQKVNSPAFSGLKVTGALTITSPGLSGLKTNEAQINGVTVDVNTGNASAGTQRVVLASNQPNVPVNVAAASTPILAGLKVDVERWSVGTPSLSGLQTVLNGSNKTIPVSLSGNQAVNIAAASTPVLSGLQVVLNGAKSGTTPALSGLQVVLNGAKGTSPSLSGLKVNQIQINGIAVDTNTGNASTGTQRVVLASNQPNVPINIAAASTPVLAGLKVDIERSISLSISSPSISGLKVNNTQINGLAISTVANGVQKVGVADSGGTAITSTGSALDINLKTASTPALAGLKVYREYIPAVVSTACIGINASTSGDNQLLPAPGAGKQIFVYAWNLSFSGTVNAKFTDGTTSKLLSGLHYGIANAGGANSVSPNFTLTKPQPDLFHTSANSRLLLNLSGGTAVGGSVSYWIQ